MSDRHLVGCFHLPVELLTASDSTQPLLGAVVLPSSTTNSLLLQQHDRNSSTAAAVATCTPAVTAAALSSSDSSTTASGSSSSSSGSSRTCGVQLPTPQALCAATLALAPTDIILTAAAAAGESSACGTYGEFLPRCRLGIKHLHLLLQQPLVQLQVVSAVDMPKQQQQEMQAALQAAAAPKKSTKRRAAAAAAANADGDMAQRFCWAVVSVELLPGFLFVPPATTTGFAGQQQQQQCGLWSLHPDLAATIDWPSDAEAAAVNALMNMLQRQQHLCSCYGHMQQLLGKQQQQQLRCYNGTAAAAAAGGTDDDGMHISDSDIDSSSSSDSDNDLEDLQSLTQQPHIQQQQQQQSGLMSSEQQLQDQLDLLCCPETAAAASEDVRQSMFDFVDSQPWQMEGRDPPGLACQLYRYQRRALAWMVWREQQQQQAGSSSSSSSSSDYAQAASGVLGAQLLNPLWTKVVLTLPHQQQQQQQLVLYHSPSHGFVSLQRPAAYVGPAGGMLCDEMGIGKTVEVFSLILAHPPPAGVLGKRAAAAADGSHAVDLLASIRHPDDHTILNSDSSDQFDDCPLFMRADEAAKRRRLAGGSGDGSDRAHQAAAAAAAIGGADAADKQHSGSGGGDGSWPAPGKWAGATLVVTPPAILQQWVAEAEKRTTGLKVEVYDGLKWQRAQSEAAARKEAGRQSRGARAAAAAIAAWSYMLDGPPDAPVFDAAAEADAAVAQLLDADVVITTYDVLQQEVYFSGGNSERLSSLRHKKRYQVPQSPLLQVDWWRLVFDEAQQVGSLSNTAVMAGYLQAKHRWVVTGTPIGAGGLSDIGNLLRLINASPFHEAHVFRSAIEHPFKQSVEAAAAALAAAATAAEPGVAAAAAGSEDADRDGMSTDPSLPTVAAVDADDADEGPLTGSTAGALLLEVLAPRYRRRERDGVRRLLALLQPLMWRTSKAVADLDHPLPPRHLQRAYLRFSPAERSFYDHILAKTAAAKQEMEQNAAAAAAADAADAATAAASRASSGRGRGKGRGGKGKGPQDLQQLAADQIAQLRRACVHPQLTSYWQELSNELQLQQGGALSISEILGRMRDEAQLKLQAAERELCSLLNARASILMAQADAAAGAAAAAEAVAAADSSGKKSKKRRRGSAAAAAAAADTAADTAAGVGQEGADGDWEPEAGSSKQQQQQRPKKRVRFAAADDDAMGEGDAAAGAGAGVDAAGSSSGGSRRRYSSSGGDGDDESLDGLRGAAWKLLEDSWAVAQHGIRAILPGSSQQDLAEPLGDISGGDATWKAWKLVEIHTAQLAASLAATRRQADEEKTWADKVSKKQDELLETPLLEEVKARTKLGKHMEKVQELEGELTSAWSEAAAAGAPLEHMTGAAAAAAWLSTLNEKLSDAKTLEQSSRQQVTHENGPAVLTTVLTTQHVPQQLDGLEGAAAADRALLEGIVGGQHAQQVSAQLHKLESTLATAAAAAAGGSGDSSRPAAAAAARSSKRVRFAAAAAATDNEGSEDDYDPAVDSDADGGDYVISQAGAHISHSLAGGSRQLAATKQQLQQAERVMSAAVANWSVNSNLPVPSRIQQRQQQQQPAEQHCTTMAAAQAATGQFLDCLPERRVLWRLLFKGALSPVSPEQQQQQQQQQLAPMGVASALGSLVNVFAATAFVSSSSSSSGSAAGAGGTGVGSSGAAAAAGPAAAAADGLAAMDPVVVLAGLQSYQSRLCLSKASALLRQFNRQIRKKRESYIRTVASAVAAADAAAAAIAATAKTAAAAAAAAAEEGRDEAAAEAAAEAASYVNVPRLLQGLPSAAVAAAAEAARLRVELCRLHKDVHQAELRLEVALHNKQLALDEAAAAAAGQTAQALAHADRSLPELARASADATKKCDELARHKRFLDNQAVESRVLADAAAAKRKKASTAAAAASDGGDAADEEEEGEVECAVCKSPMSEQLQVFGCGHYYCDDCAQQALSAPKPTCPYCRKAITRRNVFRVSLGGSGGLYEPEVDPPEGPAVTEVKVTGSWMTKIEALLRRLLLMRSADPTSKALVFSQYPGALALISKALNVVQLDHVSLGVSSGRQAVRDAIRKFTDRPEVCVFLLSLRAGSAGLTLTSATRVFLLEPAMDPSIEQQAVARVHRIGQEKEVVITRLLMADTVEEEVLKTSEAKQALLVQKEAAHSQQLHHHHSSSNHRHHTHSPHKQRQQAAADGAQQQQQQQLDTNGVPDIQANLPLQNGVQEELAEAAAAAASSSPMAAADGVGGVTSPRQQQQQQAHRRRGLTFKMRNSSGSGTAAAAAGGPLNALTGPPLRREPVGREEAVGLLQALIKPKEG